MSEELLTMDMRCRLLWSSKKGNCYDQRLSYISKK